MPEPSHSASGWDAWGRPAQPVARITLGCMSGADHKVLRNFSAGTRIDDTLFVAADEFAGVDRLTPLDATDDQTAWGHHVTFALKGLLPLAAPDGEADLEGLAADKGWLWVIGSHARTRRKPEREAGETIDLDRLARLRDTRPRCLLARLPLIRTDAGWQPAVRDGERRAGMLRQSKRGNALARALANDPLLAPFTRIPAKEGGVDIEGIAVCGERVALGMRGPVIATHAVLLEAIVKARPSGRLRLAGPPVKRLLAMEGLGIRDLKRHGDDLLILAGPTTGLSGPVALYRWPGWASDPPQNPTQVRLHRPERILELPFGRGRDHPEGLALWGEDRILVIYDSPADDRCDTAVGTVTADLFALPRAPG